MCCGVGGGGRRAEAWITGVNRVGRSPCLPRAGDVGTRSEGGRETRISLSPPTNESKRG